MPRFSVHLGNSTKFDNHFSFAIGYKYSNVIVTSNNPDLEEVRGYENEIENLLNVFSLPIGLRISYGAKYFFTDDLALALDIGIGGGTIFTGGLSYKINFQKDVPN